MYSGSSVKTLFRKKKTSSEICAEDVCKPLEDFASNTTIHGLKYALQPRRRFVERCIWVSSVVVCTAAASALVYSSIQKFYDNPTITTVESFTNETNKIPFPAITFCNVNLVFRYKADRLVNKLKIPDYKNISLERLREVLPNVAILLQPRGNIDDKMLDELLLLQQIFDANHISTLRVTKLLGQSCQDMVERCSWNGVLIECTSLNFQRKATFNGYCCTFNYDSTTNWTGHPDYDPFKLRTYEYGPGTGLRVLLNPMKDDYVWSSHMSSGFSVVVHRSGVYPDGPWMFIGPSEAYIRVTPDLTDADSSLHAVLPLRRRCAFFDELPLRNSKSYSREACVLQCRAQAVQTLCGCVPFFYATEASEKDVAPIGNEVSGSCNLKHLKCLIQHADRFESATTIDECRCWPRCNYLSYSVDLSKSNFEALEHYIGDFYEGLNASARVSINVYISSQVVQVNKRDILYTLDQLMSNLGGIFSLLLGCSLISAVEVLYYTLLRAPVLCGRVCKGGSH